MVLCCDGEVGLFLKSWSGGSGKVWDVVGHASCNAIGEGCDLFMDVHHEGIRRPAALLLDEKLITAIEFHSHCASSSERVTRDFVGSEATVV